MELIALTLFLAASPAAPATLDCGVHRQFPQYGYVLEGNVLRMPGGARHEADHAVLRETYGLVGEGLTLRRTRFVDSCGEAYTVPADATPIGAAREG